MYFCFIWESEIERFEHLSPPVAEETRFFSFQFLRAKIYNTWRRLRKQKGSRLESGIKNKDPGINFQLSLFFVHWHDF